MRGAGRDRRAAGPGDFARRRTRPGDAAARDVDAAAGSRRLRPRRTPVNLPHIYVQPSRAAYLHTSTTHLRSTYTCTYLPHIYEQCITARAVDAVAGT